MLSISFGLSAPAALDAMLLSGDEILLGFIILVLIGLSASARAVVVGTVLGCLYLLGNLLTADPGDFLNSSWLAVVLALVGVMSMAQAVISAKQRSSIQWLSPQWEKHLAGVCAFSVVVLLGGEAQRELAGIAGQYSSTLPLVLGVSIAVVNTIGFGALVLILLSWVLRSLSLSQSGSLRMIMSATVIAFGVYCVGVSLAFRWPGDELIVACIALSLWSLAYGFCRSTGSETS